MGVVEGMRGGKDGFVLFPGEAVPWIGAVVENSEEAGERKSHTEYGLTCNSHIIHLMQPWEVTCAVKLFFVFIVWEGSENKLG